MLAGTMLVVIPSFYDLVITVLELPGNSLFHYGIMFFIILQTMVNTVKESKAFSKVEILSTELKASHQALIKSYMLMERRVEERTAELKESNRELEHEIEIRKQVEQALIKAKADAEATTVAKSTFLANMSHEIRTPLNGIVGILQLLESTCRSSEQIEYIRLMDTSAGNLMNLITDILDFSRIESGKLELDRQEFNLHYLLRSHVDTFRHQAVRKIFNCGWILAATCLRGLQGIPGN